MQKKTTKQTFLATLIASILLLTSPSSQKSVKAFVTFNGCLAVTETACSECYLRKVSTTTAGCADLQPSSDTCLIYSRNALYGPSGSCTQCKQGYQLRVPLDGSASKCVGGTITNCLNEVSLGGLSPSCFACDKGYTLTGTSILGL